MQQTPLAALAGYRNGFAFKPDDRGVEGLPIVRIEQLLNPSVEPDLFAGEVPAANRIADGDLVFSWSGTLAVRLWSRGPAYLNQHLFRVDPRPGVNKQWLRWALEEAIGRMKPLMHGTAMTHITRRVLEETRVPLPPVEQQRRIADYLDTETARIYGLLAVNRRRRSLIQERLWAQLERLIEGVPTPVGYLVRRIEQGTSPVADDRAASSGEVGVLKLSAISRGRYLPQHHKALPADTSEGLPRVRPGSILLSRANTPDRVGDVAYVDHDAGDLTFPDLMFQLLIDQRVAEPRYLAMALRSRGARAQIEAVARGSSQSMVKLRQGDVRELRLPVPDYRRQVAAAEAFERAAEHARSVDDALERVSALLAERREALITAAVTGEVGV